MNKENQKISKYYISCDGKLCITVVSGIKQIPPKVYQVVGGMVGHGIFESHFMLEEIKSRL